MAESKVQQIKAQADAALEQVTEKLLENIPAAEEHLKAGEEATKMPKKYLVGVGLALLSLLVIGFLYMMNLHSFVMAAFFWGALSYRSFRAIDAASSGAAATDAQKAELKHLMAYSVVSCLFVVLDPVVSIVPGYFYAKYVILTLSYYADSWDNMLVELIKSKVTPLLNAAMGDKKAD